MSITRLGALSVDVTDLDTWRQVLVDLLGLQARPRHNDSDPLLIRLDDHHHRIALYPANEDRIRAITWEVDSLDDLRDVAERVAAEGIDVATGIRVGGLRATAIGGLDRGRVGVARDTENVIGIDHCFTRLRQVRRLPRSLLKAAAACLNPGARAVPNSLPCQTFDSENHCPNPAFLCSHDRRAATTRR